MDALATGDLVLVDNCIRLELKESGASYMLIWLPDFNLVEESENIYILNEKNVPVAAPGDRVPMDGGAIKGLMMLDKSILAQMPDWYSKPFWVMGDKFVKIDLLKCFPGAGDNSRR